MSENTVKKVYGIDLGTTYSALSVVDDGGNAAIIQNSDGQLITASAIFYDKDNNSVIVGEGAKEMAHTDPDNFVHLIKREIGTKWRKEINGEQHTPESVSAIILKYMINGADKAGHKVEDVVITCPAYFNEKEREATRIAGKIAGLNVMEVLYEPVAAAIAYGIGIASADEEEKKKTKQVIVYDLGGGTFDVTVVMISPEKIRVICTDGDHRLGGTDWDSALRDLLLNKLSQNGENVAEIMEDPETRAALITTVEKAKISLSQKDSTSPRILCKDGRKVKVDVTRQEFNEATRALLDRTMEFTDKMIATAREKTGVEKIDDFLLVGGSTYMCQVQDMVNERYKDTLGVEPKQFEPNFAVAKGAAVFGKLLLGFDWAGTDPAPDPKPEPDPEPPGPVVTHVATKSVGIKVLDREGKTLCYNLVKKQSDVPCDRVQVFPLSEANATSLPLVVYTNDVETERADLEGCTELGQAIMNLTPGLPKGAPIEITFAMDGSAHLVLTARDMTNDKALTVEFKMEDVLSEKEIEHFGDLIAPDPSGNKVGLVIE